MYSASFRIKSHPPRTGRWIFLKDWLRKVQEAVGEGEDMAWGIVGAQRQEGDWFLARRPWVSISAAGSFEKDPFVFSEETQPERESNILGVPAH